MQKLNKIMPEYGFDKELKLRIMTGIAGHIGLPKCIAVQKHAKKLQNDKSV